MDLNKLPKGIFKLKKVEPVENQVESFPETNTDGILNEKTLLHNDNTTVQRLGFNSAREHNGSNIGLSICLNRIYLDHKKMVTEDSAKQTELKKPYRLKLHEIKAENDGVLKRKEKIKTEEILNCSNKIEKLRKDIAEIRANPERLTGDKSRKASFYIGFAILFFLTIYLFIFYSSASYSSFFKEFTISEIGIANSIFDAQALSKAFKDGFTELILIITIPAVFLGLGYLIHKVQKKKDIKNSFYWLANFCNIHF